MGITSFDIFRLFSMDIADSTSSGILYDPDEEQLRKDVQQQKKDVG